MVDIYAPGTKSADCFKPARESSGRSLFLFAAGAIFGLALAGYSLLSAKGTSTGFIPPEAIALVNQKVILRSDFINQTQAEIGSLFKETTAEQRQKVLNEMIDEELLVQRGLEVGLPASDPDVRSALAAGVNLQVDADVLAKQPTEIELQDYFNEHRDRYAGEGVMRIHDLILPVPAGQTIDSFRSSADQAVADLKNGKPLESVIQTYGLKESGAIDQSDNYNFAVAAKLGDILYAEAAKLNSGDISPPVLKLGNLHILVMVSRRLPPTVDFNTVRDRIWLDVQRDARSQVEQANLSYLRGKADIILAQGYRQ